MKKLLAIVVVVLLAGCSNKIYRKHIKTAEVKCKGHGGWAQIDPAIFPTARCADGTYVGDIRK